MMLMMPTINQGQKHDKEKVTGEKNIYMTIAKRVSSNQGIVFITNNIKKNIKYAGAKSLPYTQRETQRERERERGRERERERNRDRETETERARPRERERERETHINTSCAFATVTALSLAEVWVN